MLLAGRLKPVFQPGQLLLAERDALLGLGSGQFVAEDNVLLNQFLFDAHLNLLKNPAAMFCGRYIGLLDFQRPCYRLLFAVILGKVVAEFVEAVGQDEQPTCRNRDG